MTIDQYAVVGHPISHSKSPAIHMQFAQQTNQILQYTAIDIEPELFDEKIKAFFKNGGKGLNVTVPFKEKAFELADHLSDRAKTAQAVNTLILNDDGSITGDNTDGKGLVNDLLNSTELKGKTILVIGAGGASKGVLLPIIEQQPKSITIVNRTFSKAKSLAEQFSDFYQNIQAVELDKINESFDVIVNATSASLQGQSLNINANIIAEHTVCYDMMYGKEQTVFNQWASKQGAKKTIDGLGMLVGQAAFSFYLWRGVEPQTQIVMNSIRENM
ncbi:MAG: shikimate dehydrogenase [Saccharospirillaceae bacterium]|nr:shikimate dehydrogenase [Pseudomonadales bacterium]NRB78960.1 shikimate dehydrogenase [Saccharospirillaceae bacterium]